MLNLCIIKKLQTDLKPENILLSAKVIFINKGNNNIYENSNLKLSNMNNQNNMLIKINNIISRIIINNMSNISLLNERVTIKIADFGNACFLKILIQKYFRFYFFLS